MSGSAARFTWSDFQAKPLILEPIQAIFDDLDPSRHFGPELDLQDQIGASWAVPGEVPLKYFPFLEAATAADLA